VDSSADGSEWTWETRRTVLREGTAPDFCLVVTQRRAVADTELVRIGEVAERWLHFAQAFAGLPLSDPARLTRPCLTSDKGSVRRTIRIANCSGFYGDRMRWRGKWSRVLTGDYLAELTMLILWKAPEHCSPAPRRNGLHPKHGPDHLRFPPWRRAVTTQKVPVWEVEVHLLIDRVGGSWRSA